MAFNPLSNNFQVSAPAVKAENPAVAQRTAKEPVSDVNTPAIQVAREKAVDNSRAPSQVELVSKQIEQLAEDSSFVQRGLKFQVDDTTGSTVVRVIDLDTKETIRQFPPEELLTLSRRLKELAEDGETNGVILTKEV